MGLLLHFQRVDDMDLAAGQLFDQQENTAVQIWHTRQGMSVMTLCVAYEQVMNMNFFMC